MKKKIPALENHGIWKKPQKPGKIMECEKVNLEKSWNFASDFKHFTANFLCATRTFQAISNTYICTFYCLTLNFGSFYFYHISCEYSTWANVRLYKSFLIHIHLVLVSWKNENNSGKIMEFNSGIWLKTLNKRISPNKGTPCFY